MRERILISKGDAAESLSISDRMLDDLIARKAIPIVRIGRRVLIAKTSLEVLARNLEGGSQV